MRKTKPSTGHSSRAGRKGAQGWLHCRWRLDRVMVCRASGVSDEPLLKRILTADEITAEVLALVHRITVYDEEHIEISFTFGDTNE